LDPADAYGGAFGAVSESPTGVGWEIPSAAHLVNDDAPERVTEDAIEILLPALGAPLDAHARIGVSTYACVSLDADASRTSRDAVGEVSGSKRRSFSFDRFGPKLVLGADRFVHQLVRSGAHRYVEFKALDATRVFWPSGEGRGGDAAFQEGSLDLVPSTRAEVFRDKTMSLAEKRNLMRVLKSTAARAEGSGLVVGSGDPDDANGAVGAPGTEWKDTNEPFISRETEDPLASLTARAAFTGSGFFSEALRALGLGGRAAAATQFALAFCSDDAVAAKDGFAKLAVYVSSLHKFGPTIGAALLPSYGAHEFPQAFARVAAVHGATYALRVGVARFSFSRAATKKKDDVDALVTVVTKGGQRLRCRALVLAAHALRAETAPAAWTSRMTAVIDGVAIPESLSTSPRGDARGETVVAVFPPGEGDVSSAGNRSAAADSRSRRSAIRVAQLSAATGSCPRGFRVLHASVASSDPAGTAEQDLRGVLEFLTDATGIAGAPPTAGWNVPAIPSAASEDAGGKPKTVWVCFHRDAVPLNAAATVNSGDDLHLPRNVVTCPGPDASADFADVVAVAEAAGARLWGAAFGGELFRDAADDRAGDARRRGGNASPGGTARAAGDDEDEMDALLRDLPGGIGASE
jgi:RAB protein geranylgeranyltransferase component A